jgi:hypothetical protein
MDIHTFNDEYYERLYNDEEFKNFCDGLRSLTESYYRNLDKDVLIRACVMHLAALIISPPHASFERKDIKFGDICQQIGQAITKCTLKPEYVDMVLKAVEDNIDINDLMDKYNSITDHSRRKN